MDKVGRPDIDAFEAVMLREGEGGMIKHMTARMVICRLLSEVVERVPNDVREDVPQGESNCGGMGRRHDEEGRAPGVT